MAPRAIRSKWPSSTAGRTEGPTGGGIDLVAVLKRQTQRGRHRPEIQRIAMMAQVIKIKRNGASANAVPTTLAEGELAAALAADPVRMWIGTPGGVKELFPGIDDAPSDAVYGRSDGNWLRVVLMAA